MRPFRTVLGSFSVYLFILIASGSLFAAPSITSLSPSSGPSGTSVTITGNGFGSTKGTSTVKFGGVVASTTAWGNKSITAVVPSGLASGTVGVVVEVSGTASNSVNFTVTNPFINNISVNSVLMNAAPENQLITINGNNFGASQGTNSSVTFNGLVAVPSSWSNSAISVPVRTGATTGNIVVKANGNYSPGYPFMVTPAPQPPGVHFIQGDYLATDSVPSSATVPFSIAQTAGNLNVVVVGWRGLYNISVTDSAGNAYVLAVGPTAFSSWTQSIYYAKNISGATNNNVTVTFTPRTQAPITQIAADVRIAEYSGLNTTSPLDVVAAAGGTSTTADSGFATTTNQNDVLVGAGMADGYISGAGANYTLRVIPVNANVNNSDILEDRIVTATGSYDATAVLSGSKSFLMQMVALKEAPNQAPVVNAGSNQTIVLPTNSVTLHGTASDDGLPNNTLIISWTQVSGPGTASFNTPTAAITDATFPAAGTYVLQLTANDSQLSSSSNVTVTLTAANSLALTPLAAGPNVKGATQTMTAVLKTGTGPTATPISGASVSFTVTGPNATTGSRTTDSTGTATFTYTGANSGTDTVTASYTGQNSNSANVSWLVPTQPISTTAVFGQFFFPDTPPGFAIDVTPSSKLAFTQWFPSIAFNPPSGAITGNTVVNPGTHPFTEVTTDQNGNFSGTIAAQGNGYQAGALGTPLASFEAVFTGSYTVANSGSSVVTIYVDNGFILSIGNGATLVSGPLSNPPPPPSPFGHLGVIANANTSIAVYPITINFPTAGTYPFELDYVECCGFGGGDTLTLVMMAGAPNGSGVAPPVPPSGSLLLTPISPSSLATGQNQTFTALVTDATGTALPNSTVIFNVNGANQRQSTATTNSSGQATFQYTGTNAGIDSVQASAIISGMGEYSNQVSMTWTVAGGSGAITFSPQGWIGSPFIGTAVQGQVPITVASGINLTSGTLRYWPTSNPGAVTTLNSNTTGTGTIGTFDATLLASGGYTIQLNATANGTTQLSQITVSVVGDNKPGRMKSTVTEFKVPLAGIPISITRTYDSLDKNKIEDFGYGWKLGTFIDLAVDAQNNVTLNLDGQKITFFFTPQPVFLFGSWLTPAYTAQAGVHGSLASDGCGGLLRLQSGLVCFPNTGQTYQPTVYAYTDPAGRTYTITASGQLQSIQDLNGNTITVTANGITSSVGGANVTFQRDGSGRITKITDLNNHDYIYSYIDPQGNPQPTLQSVTYPGIAQPEKYTYFPDYSLQSEIDPRGNSSSATYYSDGRLNSVTGPAVPDPNGGTGTVNFTTQYSYNLSTNTTTITNPDGGTVTHQDDSFGKPLSIIEKIDATTSRTTTYQYDSKENLNLVTDPLGHQTHYTYDANGFQTSVQLQGLPADSKTYNQFGGITSQRDAASTNIITTIYDADFNPTQVTDNLPGSPSVATFSNYDSMGNFADSTDANGKTTHYDYFQSGQFAGYLQDVIRTNGSVQEKTSYTYDLMGKVLTVTDACGNGSCPDMTVGTRHSTTYAYDQLERLSTVTDASGAAGIVTSYLYDNNGNKTDQYDAFGTALQRRTQYQYDNLNRLTQITYPDLTTKKFVYDFRGNKTTETDQLGHVTKYVYDLAGQLTSVTSAFGTADAGTVSYTYYLDSRQKTVTDETNQSTGLHTTNTYDPAGRLTSVQDALGNLTSYGYDNDGRRTSVMEPNNQAANLKTIYTYDERSRVKRIDYPPTAAQPAGTTALNFYDGMGRVTSSQDQGGQTTKKTYDDVDRLKTVTDAMNPPNGFVTTYSYDLNGNLQSILDANNHTTSFQYDTMNRRTQKTLPLLQFETYQYDSLGRLSGKTDFNRTTTTTYNYDSMDRLLSKVPSSGTGITFTYTPTGQRQQMTYGSEVANYTQYDNRDRLLTKATTEGTLTYTYDLHGNVLTINSSNTNGASLTYTYDALNRLASAKDNRVAAQGGSSNPTTYSYDATGNLAGYAYPSTVKTSNLFDPLNRQTQTCSATTSPACSAGTKLSSYLYGLRPEGNRANVTELNGRFVGYQYDNDYRLTQEQISSDPAGNNSNTQYTYDPFGNRQQLIVNGVTANTYTYDANDRLNADGYDANGNTTSSTGITNLYDFENRMAQHGTSPGLLLAYDGDGNRVSETVGGTATKFLVDDKNPTGLPQVLDEIVSGAVTRTHAYGLQRISENQQINGTWTPSFYGYDGHGNVRFLTNSGGTITDSYDYDAFGMPIRTSGTTPNQFLYSGERYDSSVGLYDLRARYFNQATGRFWARDPIESSEFCCGLSWNPYIYVKQNPVNAIDPTGRNMFETGIYYEVPFTVTPGASALSACIITALRTANYFWWHLGNLGPPYFSPVFCAWGGAPWAPSS